LDCTPQALAGCTNVRRERLALISNFSTEVPSVLLLFQYVRIPGPSKLSFFLCLSGAKDVPCREGGVEDSGSIL
jgi:hypothetical protein